MLGGCGSSNVHFKTRNLDTARKLMKKPVVVCGIDTDVGKSVVTGLLARYFMDQGKIVITQKPVQTGCADRPEDILVHRKFMGTDWLTPDEQGLTCSYCFPLPASPHLAAEHAGTEIDPTRRRASGPGADGQPAVEPSSRILSPPHGVCAG